MTRSDWWSDGVFQEWESLPWDTGYHDKNIEEILEQYPVKGSVLELGCGYGNDARWFADNGFDVTAIDISAKAIDIAVSKGGNIDYFVEDARTFSSDKKFDLVYDDRQQFTKNCDKKHYKQMNKILKEGQWYSRNACIVTKTHVEATEGDQIYYTLNNTRYIQGLRKWQPIL